MKKKYINLEDRIWLKEEEKQIQNFDKIEEVNKRIRQSKALEEKRLRERLIAEKEYQSIAEKQQEVLNDKEYLENANRLVEEEKQHNNRIRDQEKMKLLKIYDENTQKQIQ